MKYNEKAERTRLDTERGESAEGELSKLTDDAMVTEAIAKSSAKIMVKIGTLSNTAADLESEMPEAALACFLDLYTAKDRIAITVLFLRSLGPPVSQVLPGPVSCTPRPLAQPTQPR